MKAKAKTANPDPPNINRDLAFSAMQHCATNGVTRMDPTRTCTHCHQTFTAPDNNPRKRFCSKSCSNADYSARRRDKGIVGNARLKIVKGPCAFCTPGGLMQHGCSGEICMECADIRAAHLMAEIDRQQEKKMAAWVLLEAARIRPADRQPAGYQRWHAVPTGMDPLSALCEPSKQKRFKERKRLAKRAG